MICSLCKSGIEPKSNLVYYRPQRRAGMKWLFGITLVTALSCTGAWAQEAARQAKPSFNLGSASSKAAERSRPVGSLFTPPSIRILDGRPSSIHLSQSTVPLPMNAPRFIVKDGAVYLLVFENILVPVAGGGASGCFSVDLSERIERVRSLIEMFPPLSQRGAQ